MDHTGQRGGARRAALPTRRSPRADGGGAAASRRPSCPQFVPGGHCQSRRWPTEGDSLGEQQWEPGAFGLKERGVGRSGDGLELPVRASRGEGGPCALRAEVALRVLGGRAPFRVRDSWSLWGPQPVPAEDRAHCHHRYLKGAGRPWAPGEAALRLRRRRAARPRCSRCVRTGFRGPA